MYAALRLHVLPANVISSSSKNTFCFAKINATESSALGLHQVTKPLTSKSLIETKNIFFTFENVQKQKQKTFCIQPTLKRRPAFIRNLALKIRVFTQCEIIDIHSVSFIAVQTKFIKGWNQLNVLIQISYTCTLIA